LTVRILENSFNYRTDIRTSIVRFFL